MAKKEKTVHDIKKRLEASIKRVKDLKKEKDTKLILKFGDKCYSEGLSNTRVLFYLNRLKVISEMTKKNLADLTREDIEKLISKVEKSDYSEWTKFGFKTTLRNFYKKLNKGNIPEKVAWIKATPREAKIKRPVILTKEEILTLFRNAEGIREKAMVSFMYESGCRSPDELLNMKYQDVEFNDYGAMVRLVSGKTGERRILVVSCVPHLKDWIESHPTKKASSWLWVTEKGKNRGKRISYHTLERMIRKWVNKSGIGKKVTPYTFRRTRYTHLSNKWPTPVLYKYMGQVQGSKAIKRYVELSTEAVEETVLSFYKMKPKKNNEIKPLFCSRCDKQNPPEMEFCKWCNSPLTEKAITKVEEKKRIEMSDYVKNVFLKQFEEDPKFRRKLIEERKKEFGEYKSE